MAACRLDHFQYSDAGELPDCIIRNFDMLSQAKTITVSCYFSEDVLHKLLQTMQNNLEELHLYLYILDRDDFQDFTSSREVLDTPIHMKKLNTLHVSFDDHRRNKSGPLSVNLIAPQAKHLIFQRENLLKGNLLNSCQQNLETLAFIAENLEDTKDFERRLANMPHCKTLSIHFRGPVTSENFWNVLNRPQVLPSLQQLYVIGDEYLNGEELLNFVTSRRRHGVMDLQILKLDACPKIKIEASDQLRQLVPQYFQDSSYFVDDSGRPNLHKYLDKYKCFSFDR